MCGILGYIGSKPADSVLLVGLKKLEYRGYDSSGLATIDQNELMIRKTVGKVENLEKLLESQKSSSSIGIAHTRWATHGEPSVINAHPHYNTNEDMAIVHNGIIENYLELKKLLLSKDYLFLSDTDSEVIIHLIDFYYKECQNLEAAFLMTLKKLEGKYAIVFISEIETDAIFFASNECPLIVAEGKDKEYLCASDLPALIPLGKKVVFLENKQWGFINSSGIFIKNYEGSEVEVTLQPISSEINEIEKGDYAHFMLKEIYEQSKICRDIIHYRLSEKDLYFKDFDLSHDYLKSIVKVRIQACGSSLNAGRIGKIFFEYFAYIQTDAEFSSEINFRNPLIDGTTLVLPISQSGETADTLSGLYTAKSRFLKVLSIVNNTYSTMARESDFFIDMMAGVEIGVASTKAYVAEVLHLFFLALYIGCLKGIETATNFLKNNTHELLDIPPKIDKILSKTKPILEIAEYLQDKDSVIFLGRGLHYPTALEGALKLKEVSYIHATGYAAGEFKHGPIALVQDGFPVFFLVPSGSIRKKMLSSILEVKARKGKIITIIEEGDEEIKKLSDFYIEIPPTSEYLSPILYVLPLQLISYYTALNRKCDVDRPRNLAKSVTVE